MLHFVPVLTRTGSPHPAIAALPFATQIVGVAVVLGLQGLLPRIALHPAATLDFVAAVTLLAWVVMRARRTLGSPHPGWRWYAGALVLFASALVTVPLFISGIFALAARNVHLHLNTLGFVGLAALGTLPVLLPTALRRPDSQAAHWLRRRLPVAFAGVAAAAGGAAFGSPLALIGAAFLAVTAFGLLVHWGRSFGWRSLFADGAAAPLCSALAFYGALQFAGGFHAGASSLVASANLLPAFAIGFLLPLVSGALTQLLPVWRWPGPATPARQEMRHRLARCGRLRAVLLPVGGFLAIGNLVLPALGLAALALALFVADLVFALRAKLPAR